tara:strand:+ start:6994 stop:7389 length:396 start_codon:yes stop_codon:yes gene_type:complete
VASSFSEKKERKNKMRKIKTKIKRRLRNRKKLKSVNNNRYRVSVTKSLNNLFAQIIDDKEKKTLVSATSIEKELKKNKIKKIEKSTLIGEILAKRAKEKNITEVYFDRGEYKYHGRIKAFAETLRKNGMKF